MPTVYGTHLNDLPFDQFDVLAIEQSDVSHLVILIACPLVYLRFNK